MVLVETIQIVMLLYLSNLPEQTLVASTLDAGVPLSPEALSGQLQLQGDRLQVLIVTADRLKVITQPGQDSQKTGEHFFLHSISMGRKL